MEVLHANIGLTQFDDAWKLQKAIHLYKQKNRSEDIILTTEHSPVYTLGKSGDRNHLLLKEEQLKANKISYYEIDRGGDITYHGPGQLVLYPIFDLNNYYKDIHRFMRDLEEAIILTLAQYGIKGHREEEFTGVWVGNEKICAIGIKVSHWITMHGLAFNINNDLSYFDNIIPCGIFHKGVTSIKNIIGHETDFNNASEILLNNLASIFKIKIRNVSKEELNNLISEPVTI